MAVGSAKPKTTVWNSGGRSWYQDPRTVESTALWPGSVVAYTRRTRSANASDHVFTEAMEAADSNYGNAVLADVCIPPAAMRK